MSTDAEPENAYDAYLAHQASLDAAADDRRIAAGRTSGATNPATAAGGGDVEASKPPASTVILDRWPTPEENTLAAVERHKDVLLPGAPAVLAKFMTAKIGQLTPDAQAETVAKFLATPTAARWLDPEAKAPALADGRAPSPLRVALARYAPELKPGSLDALVDEWSVDLAHKPPEKIAGEVVRRLGRPENAKYLASPIHRSFVRGQLPARPEAKQAEPKPAEPPRQPDGRFATPPAAPKRLPPAF